MGVWVIPSSRSRCPAASRSAEVAPAARLATAMRSRKLNVKADFPAVCDVDAAAVSSARHADIRVKRRSSSLGAGVTTEKALPVGFPARNCCRVVAAVCSAV